MQLTKDILLEFEKITSKDIQTHFAECAIFFSTSYNRIVDYYSGVVKIPEKNVFDEFEKLFQQNDSFFQIFEQMSNRFNNVKWWLVLEKLEQIDQAFDSLKVINKWSKSSLTSVGYNPSLQATYTLRSQQTLERVSQDVLGSFDPQNDWNEIAYSNQLAEEDYTPTGGVDLQLSFPNINRGVQIESVVDIMKGKSIYGKDIDRQLHFINEDIAVLDYDNTVIQSVTILAGLYKNDNPEYPFDGLQREVAVGGSRSALNFPIISRQMTATFNSDDSLKNFAISKIEVDQDNLSIDFTVQTRLNETKEGQVVV